MKSSLFIFLFSLLGIGCVFAETTNGPLQDPITAYSAFDLPEAKAPLRTVAVRFCYKPNFGVRTCVTITVTVGLKKYEGKDLNVKASMSEDGNTLTFSGIPAPFNGEVIQIEESAFSGFLFEESKRYLQTGEYKVSNGTVKLKLNKG